MNPNMTRRVHWDDNKLSVITLLISLWMISQQQQQQQLYWPLHLTEIKLTWNKKIKTERVLAS